MSSEINDHSLCRVAVIRKGHCSTCDADLIDLIEMVCDWEASTLRHNDGNILTSIDKNQDRFGYSSDMAGCFKNTIKLFE